VLPLWKRRTEHNNFTNIPLLDDYVSKIEDLSGIGEISLPWELKQAIAMTQMNSQSLPANNSHQRVIYIMVRQPFTLNVATADVNDE